MVKALILTFLFTSQALANNTCLDYEVNPATYSEALTNYMYSSEDQTGPFYDFLRASGVELDSLKISPYPLEIKGTTVKLLAVSDKNGVVSCSLLTVRLRKMCNSVGLEYFGRARMSTEAVPAALLGDMERDLCRL